MEAPKRHEGRAIADPAAAMGADLIVMGTHGVAVIRELEARHRAARGDARDRVLAVDPISRGFGFVVLEDGLNAAVLRQLDASVVVRWRAAEGDSLPASHAEGLWGLQEPMTRGDGWTRGYS